MKLRFLHLEDNPSDAELIQLRLTREWPECQVFSVTNEADFREALGKRGFDLILADYSLPSFTGLEALSLARQVCPEIPFIFFSGMIGEEVAVEALKTGAADYVLKDRPSRLVPVIRRALQEAEDRAQRKLAEEKLRSGEEQYRDLFENATDLIQSNGPDGRFLYVNRAWQQILGYSESEAERMSIMDIVHPEYHSECRTRFQPVGRGGESGIFEAIFLTKYCCHVYVEGGVSYRMEAGKPAATWGIFRDVTQKRLAEVSLKRTMREYEDLVNAIDGIVWKAEIPGLRFTFVSLQAERLLGYPPRSWLEEPEFWQNHIHPEDRDRAVGLYTQAASENEPRSFEYRMLAADGRLVWLRDIVSARTGEGAAPQIQGIMVNITPRKQAEAARRESDALKGAIMEAALDCIVVMDEEGKIIEFNPAAEKTFGYCRTEVIGRDVAGKLIPAILRDRADRHLTKHNTAGKGPIFGKRIEVTAVRGDGSEFPVEMAIIPLREGDQSVSTAYVRDITERKAAEERVNRIQAKLELTNRDLLRKNEEIQNFYHTLSHELKTPLTSGREFISIVMDGLAGPLNETQMEYLGIAKESCNQLRVCIDDLLDATRLETGKLAIEIKPTCLCGVVQRAVTTLTPQAAEKRISLSLEVAPNLSAIPLDEHRITQVITNLLNNAIKNTPSGGSIVISAKEAPGRPELVEVSVRDTGCGIPAKEHSRIFDRLYQVKAGDATTEQGVGLGLYLCRELVQLHGGNIRVESAPGKGSTFAFILPKTQKLLRSNVLVIHGDPDARDGLKRLLEQEGFNAYGAAGRADTMEIMQRQVPDLVLLDLAMPNADGHATLEEIRNKWGTVPVIVHAGDEDGDLVKEALAFSPFTLLAKPCSAAQLVETVRKVQRGGDTAIWKKNHFDLERPRGRKVRNSARGIKRDIKPKSPRRLKL